MQETRRIGAFEAVMQQHLLQCPDSGNAPHFVLSSDPDSATESRQFLGSLGLPVLMTMRGAEEYKEVIQVKVNWKTRESDYEATVSHWSNGNQMVHTFGLKQVGEDWEIEEKGVMFGCTFDY